MRYLLVGLGNIGGKRRAVLGDRCVATVDPFNPAADFRQPEQCPDDRYDAAILAVPNDVKLRLIEFFLSRGKHVLVEKPLILDPEAAAHLSRVSQASRAIWYTSTTSVEPNVLALKRQLEGGTIGRLYGSGCSTATETPEASRAPGGTAGSDPGGHGLPPDRSHRSSSVASV